MDDNTRQRFQRQIAFPGIGRAGQEKLLASSVVQVGCGGLGSTLAQCMGRAGMKKLTIIDRDAPELTNLHRQFMFDEADAESEGNKAEIGAARMRKADSRIEIVAHAVELTAKNADELLSGHDLVMDGLDNMPTRYLINDWCVKNKAAWIYGGVLGATGMVMPVFPGEGPCLRCLFPDPGAASSGPTMEEAGIINTLPAHVATVQSTEAVKILIGAPEVVRELRIIDLWSGEVQKIKIARNPECPCCGKNRFEFLD